MENISPRLYRFIGIVALLLPLYAYADIHGTLTGTTNYVWRMYSKSRNDPAIQANLDYQHSSGFYTGASVSSFNIGPSDEETTVPFKNQARAEITPYLGWSFGVNDDWRVDLQYSRYFYDGKIYEYSGDYNEFYAFLHYKDLVTLQVAATNNFYGIGEKAFFYELTGRYPVTDYLEVSGSFGHAQTEFVTSTNYHYWNAGLTARYKFIAADLRYYDAKEFEANTLASSPNHPIPISATAVFSISVGF